MQTVAGSLAHVDVSDNKYDGAVVVQSEFPHG